MSIASIFATYCALVHAYGFGRAIVCMLNILAGTFSLLFFVAAFFSHKEENSRNAIASCVLGALILVGALLTAAIVFQPVVDDSPSSVFMLGPLLIQD